MSGRRASIIGAVEPNTSARSTSPAGAPPASCVQPEASDQTERFAFTWLSSPTRVVDRHPLGGPRDRLEAAGRGRPAFAPRPALVVDDDVDLAAGRGEGGLRRLLLDDLIVIVAIGRA